MPIAAWCSECNASVWVDPDGGCSNGHPRSSLRDLREVPLAAPSQSQAQTSGSHMEQPLGTPYRHSGWVTVYYAVFAVLWTGGALFFLLWYGRTSGWFFILGGLWAYGAVQSSRLPYAVVNASTLTVRRTPFKAETFAWRDVVAAHRIGPRVRVKLPQRRPLDLRWDAIAPEDREPFLKQLTAHLGSRWIDDPSDTRADTRRQAALAAVLAVVLVVVLAYLQRTGLIELPLRLP